MNMIRALLVPLAIVLMAGCTAMPENQETNLELIGNYVKAVENLDYDAMANYLADDYIGIGPSVGDSIDKAGAIANWVEFTTNLYESIHYDLSRNIAVTIKDGDNKGEWVSNWAELTIRYKWQPGTVTIFANTLYQIENGMIKKSYTLYNEADALRQLGFSIVKREQL
jgi:hypothetical protein